MTDDTSTLVLKDAIPAPRTSWLTPRTGTFDRSDVLTGVVFALAAGVAFMIAENPERLPVVISPGFADGNLDNPNLSHLQRTAMTCAKDTNSMLRNVILVMDGEKPDASRMPITFSDMSIKVIVGDNFIGTCTPANADTCLDGTAATLNRDNLGFFIYDKNLVKGLGELQDDIAMCLKIHARIDEPTTTEPVAAPAQVAEDAPTKPAKTRRPSNGVGGPEVD